MVSRGGIERGGGSSGEVVGEAESSQNRPRSRPAAEVGERGTMEMAALGGWGRGVR